MLYRTCVDLINEVCIKEGVLPLRRVSVPVHSDEGPIVAGHVKILIHFFELIDLHTDLPFARLRKLMTQSAFENVSR